MKVYLEQNSENSAVSYIANIEVSTVTIDINTHFRVPIHERTNGKTRYTANVCGFAVEGDDPDIVVGFIEKLVSRLINMARLPTYVFIARRSHKMYPVYTYGVSQEVYDVQVAPMTRPSDRFRSLPNWYMLTRQVIYKETQYENMAP